MREVEVYIILYVLKNLLSLKLNQELILNFEKLVVKNGIVIKIYSRIKCQSFNKCLRRTYILREQIYFKVILDFKEIFLLSFYIKSGEREGYFNNLQNKFYFF